MKRWLTPLLLLLAGSACAQTTDLSGHWRFALDRADAGLQERWAERSLPDHLQLPGVLQSQGFGDEISTNTPWVLSLYDRHWFLREDYLAYTRPGAAKVPFLCQPPGHYLGAAWYQRDVEIPESWRGKRLALCLERPHWESRVWLDDRLVGSCNSLVAPHQYELGIASPGKHRLTLRVDNRLLMTYRPDAHSVSDSLAQSWNGVVGKIELVATTPVWIEQAQAFPNVETRTVRLKVSLGNLTGAAGQGTLAAGTVTVPVSWATNGGEAELTVSLGKDARLWDEFHPALQRLTLTFRGGGAEDQREIVFGMREFRAQGPDFFINGRKTCLRGTHHGGDFPLTGYPPTDVGYWLRVFRTCTNWGLNHVRFHSFCPPDAAFTAADETGIYLQVEPGMWNEISPGTPMEKMLYAETERMIAAYGNHPSFVLCSASNEPKGAWKRSLPPWVEHFRNLDARHLYTTGTGWSLIDEPGPVAGADYLAVHRIGLNPLRGNSAWFGRDYGRSLRGVNVPVLAHELGQWCAYPDYEIIGKFTGYMRPGNYEIFRDSLAAHGLQAKGKDFAWASGRFQLACYKEEIEANLRTPGLTGFQLLDLHDYVGQGTALVGLLDTFWESKGYVSAPEFRRFCSPTVPLARLRNRVFSPADTFEAEVEVAHFGPAPLADASAAWKVVDRSGQEVQQGSWPTRTIPVGRDFVLGTVKADLAKLAAPGAYKLVVTVGNVFTNDWDFWLVPGGSDAPVPVGVLVTSSWDDAEAALSAGGKVLFLPHPANLDWTSPPLDGLPVFWNRLMNPGWGRMLGLWCDTNHPALASFPTEPNCDWQWTELVRRVRAVNLDRLPNALQPIVQAIDDWNRNYKLALLFECKVGPGRLMVSAVDLQSDLAARPVASQLRRSVLDYLGSSRFQPGVSVSAGDLRRLWFDTRVMQKLGAKAEADGADASAILDGDPNTVWSAGGGRSASGRKHPYVLTVTFPEPVKMTGLVLMNRQNDRDHLGDIRGYQLEASDDGQSWRELQRGELASTWSPQTLNFAGPVSALKLRLTALSGFGGDVSAALAELAVLYAGPKLPDTGPAEIIYRRARSTSTDVEEGTPAPSGKAKKRTNP